MPIHALFRCEDCGKEWGDKDKAQKQAYNHSRTTGHRVFGEVAWGYRYGYKNEQD